jgi:P4 family phage/plasmid primase-like protien
MNVVLQNAHITESPTHSMYDSVTVDEPLPTSVSAKPRGRGRPASTTSIASTSSNEKVTKAKPTTPVKKQNPFSEYLFKHITKKEENKEITNTRIGGGEKNLYGGSYHIPDSEYSEFIDLLYKYVISANAEEYLTEKQLESDGPILVDVDLRFPYEMTERQYSKEHIEDLIELYLGELKKMYHFDEDTQISVFVFEKSAVNRLADKNITKDGIHMIIGLKADHVVQQILRKRIVEKIAEIWEGIPITNNWSDVFDEGISTGKTNWQLYGCRKPDHEPYRLTQVYRIGYDAVDQETTMREIKDYRVDSKNVHQLSVRYRGHPTFLFKSSFLDEYRTAKGSGGRAGNNSRNTTPVRQRGGAALASVTNYIDIHSREELEQAVGHFLDGLGLTEYELRESYYYTMSLPESYYGDYNKWLRVGWALRNISDRLFIVWAAFSAQWSKFDFRTGIRDLYEKWVTFDLESKDGLTKRSIMHWSKHDAKEKYYQIRTSSIDYYIDETVNKWTIESLHSSGDNGRTLRGSGDVDLATILYLLHKDEYVCASVRDKKWYRYENHRWAENDSGTSLRMSISTKMRDLYHKKAISMCTEASRMLQLDPENEAGIKKKNRANQMLSICEKLSNTNTKKNIMTEAMELFYDGKFTEKIDSNPYLLSFTNGVFDFKEKRFRQGYPEDNVSKCTNIEYRPLTAADKPMIDEIEEFMRKLFPVKELYQYMWDHLASTLIGTTANQTFNMYIGDGQNGKSVLVDLMAKVLGDYKVIVPLTAVVTSQRTRVGGTAAELVALRGARYAVMQEPSKGDKLNEGIMKELTGGDMIQARAPYSITASKFMPQFKLVVCANNMFEIASRDHGTWRRIRKVDFLSLFTENPVNGDPDKPYQYLLDKHITEKFDAWKEVFMALLVKRACETNGVVKDCPIVLQSSLAYKESQDYIAEFIRDKVTSDPNGKILKTELNAEFAAWYRSTFAQNNPPPREIHEYMDKKYGKYTKHKAWVGAKIKYDHDVVEEESDVDDDMEEIYGEDDV